MITKAEIQKALQNEFERQNNEILEKEKIEKPNWSRKLSEDDFISNLEYKKELQLGDLNFKFVTQEGGEDQGSHYFFIHKVSRGEESVLVQFTGNYDSYNGTEFYNQIKDFKLVEPFEKVTIAYREIK